MNSQTGMVYNTFMLDVLETAAKKAGKVIGEYFEQGVTPNYKTSHQDIVTEADIQGQKIVIETITSLMREKGISEDDFGFIGEENMHSVVNKKYIFVIDPVDGTTNFASGLPMYGVEIGLFIDKILSAGVVYQPSVDKLFSAEKGKGAYKIQNGKKTKLTVQSLPLSKSLLIVNAEGMSHVHEGLLKIQKQIKNLRMLGSACADICFVVENIGNIAIEIGGKIWDFAGVHMIVEEAGGAFIDFEGKPIEYDLSNIQKRYSILAVHPERVLEILKYFSTDH